MLKWILEILIMRKYAYNLIFLTILIAISSTSFSQSSSSKHPVSSKRPTNGKYIEHFANGKIKLEENYKDGVLDGMSKRYYSNGNLRSLTHLKNGEFTWQKTYFENEKLNSVERYHKDGGWEKKNFLQNGNLIIEKSCDENLKNCQSKEYYYTGELRSVEISKGYFGLIKEYYKSGELKSEVPKKRGMANGVAKVYFKNGNLFYEIPYQQWVIQGTAKEYFKNGKIRLGLKVKDNNITQENWYSLDGSRINAPSGAEKMQSRLYQIVKEIKKPFIFFK